MSVRGMTQEQFDAFADEMHVLVAEQAALWEFPAQVTDHERDGTLTVRGPWRWEDCRDALLFWLDAGPVQLYSHQRVDQSEQFEEVDLSEQDARAALLEAAAWRQPTPADGWRLSRWGQVYAYAPAESPSPDPDTWHGNSDGCGMVASRGGFKGSAQQLVEFA